MNRRELLQRTIAWTALNAAAGSFPWSALAAAGKSAHLVLGDVPESPGKGASPDAEGFVNVVDLMTGKISRHPVPLWAHSCVPHPRHPERVLAVTKWGRSAVEVDLRNGKILASLKAPEGFLYFGHGAFDPRGERAFITGDGNAPGTSRLFVYRVSDWTLEKAVDIGSRRPHECLLTSKNQLAVAGNRGIAPADAGSLTLIDPATLEIRKTVATPSISHVVERGSHRFFVSGGATETRCELALVDASERAGKVTDFRSSPDFPKTDFKGEALSLQPLSDSIVAVTAPQEDGIVVWDASVNKLKFLKTPRGPKGLALEGGKLYVNCTLAGDVFSLDARDPAAVGPKLAEWRKKIGNGRHMKLVVF